MPDMDSDRLREEWLREEAAAFEGWDFSHLRGRMVEGELPWSYDDILQECLRPECRLLDMGTGGGEFLLSLGHPPKNTAVTEGYAPNAELCRERLEPMGITVRQIDDDDRIPYGDEEFDIVMNRHESFDAGEVFRVLKPGGVFITQQVGGRNNLVLSSFLLDDFEPKLPDHDLAHNCELVRAAGFMVSQEGEFFPSLTFSDVGAVVYFAKIIEWEFPGFGVDACFDALLRLHGEVRTHGTVETTEHRFLIVADKR